MEKNRLHSLLRKFRFYQSYRSTPPWDSQISPPELLEFLEKTHSGRALDIGCGTGTNAITLAANGWQVEALDYIPLAIRAARKKARRNGFQIAFYRADFLRQAFLQGQFDLVLDIGCYHSLDDDQKILYEKKIDQYLSETGSFLLYGFIKTDNGRNAITSKDLNRLFERFMLIEKRDGMGLFDRPSVWLLFRR